MLRALVVLMLCWVRGATAVSIPRPPVDTTSAILALYRDATTQQLQASASIDTKTGFVLALDTGLAAMVSLLHHGNALEFAGLLVAIGAGAFSVLSRRFLFGPHPDWIYTNFGSNSLDEVNLVLIQGFSDAVRFNDHLLTWKARFLLAAVIGTLATVGLLGLESVGVRL